MQLLRKNGSQTQPKNKMNKMNKNKSSRIKWIKVKTRYTCLAQDEESWIFIHMPQFKKREASLTTYSRMQISRSIITSYGRSNCVFNAFSGDAILLATRSQIVPPCISYGRRRVNNMAMGPLDSYEHSWKNITGKNSVLVSRWNLHHYMLNGQGWINH